MSDLIEFKKVVKKLLCENNHKKMDFSKILKVKWDLEKELNQEDVIEITPQMVYEKLLELYPNY